MNLQVAKARLDVKRRKKTEQVAKERYVIADHVRTNKTPRARIAVEHIIREDYKIEAMDRVEAYLETLLMRLQLLKNHPKNGPVDSSIEIPLCNVVWAAPFLAQEIPELLEIVKMLKKNFGLEYVAACEANKFNLVDTDLLRCLSCDHVAKLLIEKYLLEICRTQNVPFDPDRSVMVQDEFWTAGAQYVQPPASSSSSDEKRFPPPPNDNFGGGNGAGRIDFAPPQGQYEKPPPKYVEPDVRYPPLSGGPSLPPPFPRPVVPQTPQYGFAPGAHAPARPIDPFPQVPNIQSQGFHPNSSAPPPPSDSQDFDELFRRFDQLKNQK